MKLELNEHELDYLTMVIEQNLEDVNETEEDTQRLYFEMLEDLYSKLVVLNKLNIEEEEEMEKIRWIMEEEEEKFKEKDRWD